MKTVTVPTYLSIDLSFEAVGLGKRFGAFIIDWIIKFCYIFFINTVLSINIFNGSPVISFIVYIPFIFYSFLLEWLNNGQTLGKIAVKSRVIGMEGNVPSVSQCATRWIFNAADVWLLYLFVFISPVMAGLGLFSPIIGAVVILTSKNHQRLGDMAARTLVVNAQETEVSIFDTIYAYMVKKDNYQPKFSEIMRLPDKDITLIKSLLERANATWDSALANRLAEHIKKVLKIESKQDDLTFLRQLLEDYNYYSLQDKDFGLGSRNENNYKK